MLLGTFDLLSLTGRHPTESRQESPSCVCGEGWVVMVCGGGGGGGGCSCVICVFFSVKKSCHFTTVFLVGRYFYLFTLSLGLWIFFFNLGPISVSVGENRGVWTRYPQGSTPYPRPFFSSLPRPLFFPYFSSGYPRPKLRFFLCSAPTHFPSKAPLPPPP